MKSLRVVAVSLMALLFGLTALSDLEHCETLRQSCASRSDLLDDHNGTLDLEADERVDMSNRVNSRPC